jgi:mono/diheme cytochrome c family protein
LILALRSQSVGALRALRVPNPALRLVVPGALVMLVASLATAPMRAVLHFTAPSLRDIGVVLAASGLGLLAFDMVKIGRVRGGASMRSARSVVLLLTMMLLAAARSPARAAEPASGELLYRRYCASCHGVGGRGDGPVAGALQPPPSDLTRLDSDVRDLMRQIDGRRAVRAHGTSEMPVWGEVFEESLIHEPHRRRTTLMHLRALAEYVRSVRQRKSDAP